MELENALFKWCVEQRAKKMPLDDAVLKQKAVSLWPAVPAFWLQQFKFKYNLNFTTEGICIKRENLSQMEPTEDIEENQNSIAEAQLDLEALPPSISNSKTGTITLRQQIALLEDLEKGAMVAVLAHKYGITAAKVYSIKYKRDRILLYAKESIENGEEANLDQNVLPARQLNMPFEKKLKILAEFDAGATLQELAQRHNETQTTIFGIIERRPSLSPKVSNSSAEKLRFGKSVKKLKKEASMERETMVVKEDDAIYYITSQLHEDTFPDEPQTSQLFFSRKFDEKSVMSANQCVPNKSKVPVSFGIKRKHELPKYENGTIKKRIECNEGPRTNFDDEFDRWRNEIKLSCRSLATTKQSHAATSTVKEEIILLSDDDDDDNNTKKKFCYLSDDNRQVEAVNDDDDENCEYILPDDDGVSENPYRSQPISTSILRQKLQESFTDPVVPKLCDLTGNERKWHSCFALADEKFQTIFGLPKSICQHVLAEISEFMEERKQISGLSKQQRLLVALRYFTQGNYCRQKRFEEECLHILNVSQSSFHRCVSEVSNILNEHCMAKYVKFPSTLEELDAVEKSFFENFNVPGVIGTIGHTYVRMKTPHSYRGYAMHVQLVCDHLMRISDCYSCFSTTISSASMWKESHLRRILEKIFLNEEKTFWLLGDSRYPQQPNLMTPFRGSNITAAEANYNEQHRRARNCVRRCIELLTSKFRCLSRARAMYHNPASSTKIINSCIILYNLLIEHNIVNNINISVGTHDDQEDDVLPENGLNDTELTEDYAGIAARQKMVDEHF